MNARTTSRLAWSFLGLGAVFGSLAVVFLIAGADTAPPEGQFGFRGFALIFLAAFGTIGALIASRQPSNPIGWILCAIGVVSGFQELANEYAIYAVIERRGELPLGEVAAWFPAWIWIPATSGALFVLLLFPNGHLPSPRWRWVVVAGSVGTLAGAAAFAVLPGPLENFGVIDNPFGAEPREVVLVIATIGELVYGLAIILGAVSLVVRFRRSKSDERQQLKWLAASGVFLAVALFTSVIGQALATQRDAPFGVTFGVALLVIAGFFSLPIAMGFAILKYRLYDIDIVINRAVVYALLAAFATLVYIGIVVGVGTAVGTRGDAFLSAVAAAVVAIAFQPVRRWAQRLANRLVYGKRATPYEVLSELSDRLAGGYAADDVLPRIASILGQGIGAQRVVVMLHVGTALRPASVWPAGARLPDEIRTAEGEPPELVDGARVFPVRHQGELLGALLVSKPASEPLTPVDDQLVVDLASQAGLVMRNVRLIEELRASRQRIVTAQDERARRLERDIHDGAQQQLVALAIKLRLAEQVARADGEKAAAMMADLQRDATDALENLRDLARGIYPPLLADKGLAAALDAHARKSPVPVSVHSDGIARYPQEVEAAVYFCALEALQNAAKYANATRVTMTLAASSDELTFSVEDDGIGFDPQAPRGAGLANMRDRLEALGGALELRSAPGAGTRVTGRISVAPRGAVP